MITRELQQGLQTFSEDINKMLIESLVGKLAEATGKSENEIKQEVMSDCLQQIEKAVKGGVNCLKS